VAKTCVSDLGLKLPVLIDDMKNTTEKGYSAWPDRLFLIGSDRKVVYRGGQGPRGFRPSELEAAMKDFVSEGKRKELSEDDRKAILERLRARRKKKLEKKKLEEKEGE
jgi:iodothyronine deiodinase-like protein